jgi:hypothetical protein
METQIGGFYRLDTFRNVPAAGRDEFLQRVEMTHQVLRAQDGFIRDYLLEQRLPDGSSTIVSMAEWTSADVVPRVAAVIKAMHEREGFAPHELIERLGIDAEFGKYQPIAIEEQAR